MGQRAQRLGDPPLLLELDGRGMGATHSWREGLRHQYGHPCNTLTTQHIPVMTAGGFSGRNITSASHELASAYESLHPESQVLYLYLHWLLALFHLLPFLPG